MITPEEFPYIKSLYVNDCYAYKDFPIELHDYKPFSHLILTGKNGSGKSTILRTIDKHIAHWRRHNVFDPFMLRGNSNESVKYAKDQINELYELEKKYISDSKRIKALKQTVSMYCGVIPYFLNYPSELGADYRSQIVYSFLQSNRESKVNQVTTITKGSEFEKKLTDPDSTNYFVKQFKQYLVNKKVFQAFNQLDKDQVRWSEAEDFFQNLTVAFRAVFEDEKLELVFERDSFEFLLLLSDGRQLTFDVLSEGFSAVLSILMDLFMRVDLIRKQINDYTYNPCGIVLIDEPETHLHLQLQEQVLPLLTSLFPNVQFIAATHSPAVIASIKNATIFDLTTKESRGSEETVGRSYSDLMRGHFGMNNEYSGIADELFRKVDQILKDYKNQPEELKTKLQEFFVENEAYLSPSFRVELESMILENA